MDGVNLDRPTSRGRNGHSDRRACAGRAPASRRAHGSPRRSRSSRPAPRSPCSCESAGHSALGLEAERRAQLGWRPWRERGGALLRRRDWRIDLVEPGRRLAHRFEEHAVAVVAAKTCDEHRAIRTRRWIVAEREAVIGVDEDEATRHARACENVGLEHRATAVAVAQLGVLVCGVDRKARRCRARGRQTRHA